MNAAVKGSLSTKYEPPRTSVKESLLKLEDHYEYEGTMRLDVQKEFYGEVP